MENLVVTVLHPVLLPQLVFCFVVGIMVAQCALVQALLVVLFSVLVVLTVRHLNVTVLGELRSRLCIAFKPGLVQLIKVVSVIGVTLCDWFEICLAERAEEARRLLVVARLADNSSSAAFIFGEAQLRAAHLKGCPWSLLADETYQVLNVVVVS